MNWISPPRLSQDVLDEFQRQANNTTHAANELADSMDGIVKKAKEEQIDPFAVLIHNVRKATFKKQIRDGGKE